MSNQGIYREPGAHGGLPLPRARIVPLTIVLALLALVAVAMGPLLLAVTGRGMPGAWRLFREGGLSMWLILLADLGGPIVVAALGAFVLRGKRLPAGLLFVVAALPFVVALLGAWLGQRMVLGAISGESVDPEQKARILAEGVAESMATDIFGGYVVCGIAIVAAAASAFALASIDVGSATRGGSKPSSFGTLAAGAAGAAWLVATLVLGVVRLRAAGPVVLLTVLPVVVLAPLAVLAARGAAVLRAWHDREEASRAAGTLVVAALSALLAVLVLERAVDATFTAQALSAIAGESVDESQRARILAYALEAGHLAPVAFAIQAVLGTATFGLALAPALGSGRHPFTASAALAMVGGAVLMSGALALGYGRTAAPRLLAATRADSSDGVTLPLVVETFSHKGSSGSDGARMVLKADGTGEGKVDASCRSRFQLQADRAATVAMLRARVGTPELIACPQRLVFAVRREHPKDLDARLGYLAGYLGTRAFLPITMNAGFADAGEPRSRGRMRVAIVADDAVEIDGARFSLPLAAGAVPSSPSGEPTTRIDYVFRPTDTIERVVQTIAAVESAYDAHLATWQLERFLDDGARPPPPPIPSFPPVPGSSGVRVGAVAVNGRLPPEVVQRVVRQNQGRMRLCYENGLRKDPALRGRVTVKFVIDRSGSVAAASDGGSDLPDREVVACVVRAFGNLSFPQPEGGIVTVVYPLVFTHAD